MAEGPEERKARCFSAAFSGGRLALLLVEPQETSTKQLYDMNATRLAPKLSLPNENHNRYAQTMMY